MTEEEVRNKQVILKNYVSGLPKESDFQIINTTIKLKLPEDSFATLVKNLYLSCYPVMVPLGTPILGFGISRVLESTHPDLNKGDLVSGVTKWEEFSIITDTRSHFKILNMDFPLSYYTIISGPPALDAYIGFYTICNPQKGERVFISTSSNLTGQLVGQFAKLSGCYVVASANSKEKIDFLKNTLGFDDSFVDEEDEDLVAALKRYFPEGIDICFDNVGGKTLDAVLANMRNDGRIAVNAPNFSSSPGVPQYFHNFRTLTTKSILMKGFSTKNYFHMHPKYMEMMLRGMKENKVIYEEDIIEGLENVPTTLVGIFSSAQIVQKKVLLVARE